MDKKLPYMTVRSIAFNKWAKFGLSDVLSNDKGFYFFQFGVSGAYRQIVEAGPWHFGGRLMVLQQWSPDLEFEKEGLNRLPIWVQLHDVPLQLWTAPGLSYIASSVGRPLYADGMTETGKRISYAKICVEVTVDSPLHHSDEVTLVSSIPGDLLSVRAAKCLVILTVLGR